ncbi:cell division protein ZipA [Pseudohaliea rubra]|uniref:Cell division protein ZipA n=1 Tax=Pseudohaliea rubra DSM 19751 TaxID=1265313 RepID=A0A095VQM4_9GAMM|nr:cell division protein ZipA [Pseudohaliea rubra]KGE03418.1 Cell division protein ZipA [Pseudohaliea rubra DSM 19751]
MELTIRDWMVIIGVLLIAAVLVDAWRRVRAEREAEVRVKLRRVCEDDDEPAQEHPSVLQELPNGGARVIRREDLVRVTRAHDEAVQAAADAAAAGAPETTDSAAGAVEPGGKPAARQSRARRSTGGARADDGLVSGVTTSERDEEPGNLDWLEDLSAADEPEAQAGDDAGRLPRGETPEVFLLHVFAKDPAGFRGDDILQILLACDLRFGDMDFFHRHEQAAGRGQIQFSVANMMQPGVFDIDRMSDLTTPGLLFFVTLPGPEDMMKAFDYMLETAQAVARNLGGEVYDESRSALTRQSLEHSRQKIRDLERRLLAGSR